jgi:hypothetical protein
MVTATTQVSTPQRHGAGWLVPSRTTEGTFYFVDGAKQRCTCPANHWRGRCWHLDAVRRMDQHQSGEEEVS